MSDRRPVFVQVPGRAPMLAHGHRDPVAGGWSGYDRGDVENRPEKVHYDVLRESGFPADRAREIARASAAQQGVLLEEHRGERTASRPADGGSKFRTPHFGPFAGRLCRVLANGDLEPVEGS